jgi:hypothetical protein
MVNFLRPSRWAKCKESDGFGILETSGLRRTGTVISYYRFPCVLLKRGVQGESDSVSMKEK